LTENKYVHGKKNARAAKTERRVWVQEKISTYQRELASLDVEIEADDKIIDKLDKLEMRKTVLEENLESIKRRIATIDPSEMEAALEGFMRTKEDITKVEAEMRLVYYGR
jgi:hypothetical protein